MIDMVSLLLNNNCHADCSFCISKNNTFCETKFTESFRSFTNQKLITLMMIGNENKTKTFSISGLRGDPLYFEWLYDVLAIAKMFNGRTSIHTNGFALDNYGFDYFNDVNMTISLYSFNNSINKKVMNTNKSNEPIINYIVNSKNKPKLSRVISCSDSKKDIIEYINTAKSFGINRVVLRKNEAEFVPDLIIGKETGTIYNNIITNYNNVEITLWDYKKSNLKGLYLYPDGTIRDKYILQ